MRSLLLMLATLTTLAAFGCDASSAADAPKQLAVGQPAPQFTLQDQNGNDVSLKDYAGKLVVLEWVNPKCPYVQRHYRSHTMTTLADKYKSDVSWISINSSSFITTAANKAWATEQQLSYPVLNDAKGTVGHAYNATNTPEMYIIGKDGNVLYIGAIDNDREGDRTDGKVNYVDQALSEILAGKPVSVPQTTPYGCTVKYAD